jgi:hypothetical protein
MMALSQETAEWYRTKKTTERICPRWAEAKTNNLNGLTRNRELLRVLNFFHLPIQKSRERNNMFCVLDTT